MGKGIGIEPRYDPDGIRDPIVKGFVNSAMRYAMDQANPSEAAAGFRKALARTDFARLNERYMVPAARLRHQMRARNAQQILAEAEQELEKLEKDLSRAGGYWRKIFSYVTSRYFSKRRGEIHAALKEARWHPYLSIRSARSLYGCPKMRDVKYLDTKDAYRVFYAMPTDKWQKERYARIEKIKHAEEDYGWIFVREAFGLLAHENCLIIQNIQTVKISNKRAISACIAPPIDTAIGKKELAELAARKKGRAKELAQDLVFRHAILKLAGQGQMELTPERLIEELEKFDATAAELAKEPGLEELCARIRRWRAGHPDLAEMQKLARLHSPQTIQPIGFLPALLAGIYAMEKENPEKMEDATALLIDTSWIGRARTQAYIGERKSPKELEEYRKLAEILGAEKIDEYKYIARFG